MTITFITESGHKFAEKHITKIETTETHYKLFFDKRWRPTMVYMLLPRESHTIDSITVEA